MEREEGTEKGTMMLELECQIFLLVSLFKLLPPAEDLKSPTPLSTSLSCSGTTVKSKVLHQPSMYSAEFDLWKHFLTQQHVFYLVGDTKL